MTNCSLGMNNEKDSSSNTKSGERFIKTTIENVSWTSGAEMGWEGWVLFLQIFDYVTITSGRLIFLNECYFWF